MVSVGSGRVAEPAFTPAAKSQSEGQLERVGFVPEIVGVSQDEPGVREFLAMGRKEREGGTANLA